MPHWTPGAAAQRLRQAEGREVAATIYDLLRQRCGLSQQEAAEFHDVGIDAVKSWCSGRNPAKPEVLAELRMLHQAIVRAGGALVGRIAALGKGGEPVKIGMPHDDREALALGFPCVGAHAAAVGSALAALPDAVTVEFVPYGGDRTTPTAVVRKTTRQAGRTR